MAPLRLGRKLAETIRDWLGFCTEVFVRCAFKKTIAERGPEGNGLRRLGCV